MSVRTPILVTSSAQALPANKAVAAVPSINVVRRISYFPPEFDFVISDAEVALELLLIGRQLAVLDHIDDLAMLDDEVTVRDSGREMEVLLNEQHREATLLQGANDFTDMLHDHGGEALGRLVEQQQLGTRAQDASDRQY